MGYVLIKKNITRNILLISGVLIIGIVFLQGHGLVVGHEENQNDQNLQIGLWTPDTTVEQTFIASQNNLSRLDFAVESYQPWDSPYLDCRLFEIDTAENPHNLTYEFIRNHIKEVRYKRINGWLLSIHMFNSFSFAPLIDSKDKRYILSIRSPGLKTGGTSILLASPRERYESGHLFVDEEKQKGDLAFRALYEQPRRQVIRQSFARLAFYKPFPFSKPLLYALLFTMYPLVLLLFLYQAFKER